MGKNLPFFDRQDLYERGPRQAAQLRHDHPHPGEDEEVNHPHHHPHTGEDEEVTHPHRVIILIL